LRDVGEQNKIVFGENNVQRITACISLRYNSSMQFRVPEILLGVFLTVAVLAIGMLLSAEGRISFDLHLLVTSVLAFATVFLVIAKIGRKGLFGKVFQGLNFLSPFLTAIATVGLVWLAYWQWQTLEKSDESNRQVNRAFVIGQTINISNALPLYWRFSPVIENSGNTRAQNVEVHVYYDFSGDVNDRDTEKRTRPPFTPVADPEDLLKANIDSEFSNFDGIPLNLKSSYPVGGQGYPFKYIDGMAERRADGYISGVIMYDDVFKGSKRHISKFCFVIQPVKKGAEPTTISGGLCRFWNCVDEIECDAQKRKYLAELKDIARRR
jgi:hypothetical protein